jgi:hypothetical protein
MKIPCKTGGSTIDRQRIVDHNDSAMTRKWREWFGWGGGTEKGSYAAPSEVGKTKGAEPLAWKPKPPKTYDPRFQGLGGF